jgi:hypothetical protein
MSPSPQAAAPVLPSPPVVSVVPEVELVEVGSAVVEDVVVGSPVVPVDAMVVVLGSVSVTSTGGWSESSEQAAANRATNPTTKERVDIAGNYTEVALLEEGEPEDQNGPPAEPVTARNLGARS